LIFSPWNKRGKRWQPTLTDAALEVTDLSFWYQEEAPVLRGIDLLVPCNQFLALVGANGSGKTTLVKHFNGLLRARLGEVRVAGQPTAPLSVGELARQVGFLFQHPEQQIFAASVYQEVAFGPRNLGLSSEQVEARVEAALVRFGLTPLAGQAPAILGYGTRRRVTLASLAAMDPPVVVLDEPTVGLDAPGLRETFAWIEELHCAGRTIVLVSHDMSLAAKHAERVVVLHEGQILADGPPGTVFRQQKVLARASLLPPPVFSLAQALKGYGLGGDCLSVEAFCDEYAALARDRGPEL
jgi:energy-coupling factor transporter ATP-binding protein EcfA2